MSDTVVTPTDLDGGDSESPVEHSEGAHQAACVEATPAWCRSSLVSIILGAYFEIRSPHVPLGGQPRQPLHSVLASSSFSVSPRSGFSSSATSTFRLAGSPPSVPPSARSSCDTIVQLAVVGGAALGDDRDDRDRHHSGRDHDRAESTLVHHHLGRFALLGGRRHLAHRRPEQRRCRFRFKRRFSTASSTSICRPPGRGSSVSPRPQECPS